MKNFSLGCVRVRLIFCVILALVPSCGDQDRGIVDETRWEATKPLAEVSELALSCTFSKRFPIEYHPYARDHLSRGLADRGFTLNQDSGHRLQANFLGLWTGSRGVPVSTRYAKVSVAVNLTNRGGEEKLIEGKIDGVIDEGDVSFLDVTKNRRIERAIDSAIGKLCRQLYLLKQPIYAVGGTNTGRLVFPDVPVEKRESLAVIDFRSGEGVQSEVGRALADICRNAVGTTHQYRLLDRAHMKSILGEQDFAAVVKCDQTKCLVTYGKMLHAQKMVHGRISRLGERHVLYLALIDVNTSQIDATVTAFTGRRVEEFASTVPLKARELVSSAIRIRGKED